MNRVLELKFKLENDAQLTLSIPNPKENLTAADISQAMQTIVDANIFEREGNSIVGKISARIVDREVQEINIA